MKPPERYPDPPPGTHPAPPPVEEGQPGYSLTPGERAIMLQLDAKLKEAKCQVYDLQVQLEQAMKEVSGAQQLVIGAVTLLANAHGMANARMLPDRTRIIPQ